MSFARYVISRGAVVFATFIAALVLFFLLTRVIPAVALGANPFLPSQSLDPLFRAVIKSSDDPGYSSWVASLTATYGLSRPPSPGSAYHIPQELPHI